MTLPARSLITLACGLAVLPALAMDNTLAGAGYTGLGITPNAHLLGWGRIEAQYENQLSGIPSNTTGHNYVLGFGLFPNLEISGRLATNTLDNNCFVAPGCGARDLSASGKVGIGLDAAGRFRVAAGATDLGGAVTYFRTFYGVLTYDQGPFQASAGLARRGTNSINGSRSPLDGPFGSLAWQPLPLLRGQVEYADGTAWAGVQLFAPPQWLPEGWQLSAGLNRRLNDSRLTRSSWVGANLSIPLYKVPALPGTSKAPLPALQQGEQRLPAYEARVLPHAPAAPASPAPQSAPAVPPPSAPAPRTSADPRTLQALADNLQAKGLEDIWIGRTPDGMVAVRANNGTYQWNSLDALGAALGAVARTLGDSRAGYRLILTQRQVPLVAVTGQADCLREWIDGPSNSCTAGQLSTPGTMPLEPLHAGVEWVVRRQKPAWQTLRVTVSPVLRTRVGTELGALDYDLAANVETQLPLWSGASVEWAVNVPLARTNDFEVGRVFGQDRIRSTTDRLTFTQSLRVPLERLLPDADSHYYGSGALTAQAVVGRIGTFYDGALGALRWEPGEGRHRLSAEAGLFRNNSFENGRGPLDSLRRGTPLLGSYRYSFMPTRTDLEVTAGRFMNNDAGLRLGMRQWFADTAVELYYRRSAFPGQRTIQSAGIGVSLPLGPRQAWRPVPYLQVAGSQRFLQRIETTLREPGGGNPISRGMGVEPPVPGLEANFNSDRAGLAYFEDNLRRIRDAAR